MMATTNISQLVNGHNDNTNNNDDNDENKNDIDIKCYNFVNMDELHKTMLVPLSSQRSISITNIEERYQQNRLSKTKYSVYTIHCDPPLIDDVDIEVNRRYNDFKWLRKVLIECFPSIYIPPIPPQKMIGRFNKKFTEQRKKDLERFLNRINSIKPISESLVLTIFLSRPEQTFNVSKDEITRNHLPTIKQKILFLSKLFPEFCINDKFIEKYIFLTDIDLYNDEYKTNDKIIKYKENANDIIFGNDIIECHAFLKRICNKMSILCDIAKKLNDKLFKLKQCTKKFNDSFWRLHSKNEVFKFQCNLNKNEQLTIFGDNKRDFYGWYSYNKSIYDINSNLLYIHLKYQYQDINAFIDLFVNRRKILSKFDAVCLRNKNWKNLIELKYDLQSHQLTQIIMDYKQEKLLRYLLLLNTKIILNFNIYTIWGQIINDWQQMMVKYAQKQLLSHQILYAESYQDDEDIDNDHHNDDNDDDDDDDYEYEAVFDDDDSRQYSHNHAERIIIEENENENDDNNISLETISDVDDNLLLIDNNNNNLQIN